MSFLMIKLHEEKSYRVSPHVASNFFKPNSHATCRIQLVGLCVTAINGCVRMPVSQELQKCRSREIRNVHKIEIRLLTPCTNQRDI